MEKYYAGYTFVKSEVAVFNSEEERDQWVKHNDAFSLAMNNRRKDRKPLTRAQALSRVGKALDEKPIKDVILDNVFWAIA